MAEDLTREKMAEIDRRAPPHVRRLAAYVAGPLWQTIQRQAEAAGFDHMTAANIAAETCAQVMRTYGRLEQLYAASRRQQDR